MACAMHYLRLCDEQYVGGKIITGQLYLCQVYGATNKGEKYMPSKLNLSKNAVDMLKTETANSQAAEDVMNLLAERQRSRSTLSVSALSQQMRKRGIKHSPSEYREVLGLIAKLGVATKVMSSRGKVQALRNIKVNLSSLGKLAKGEKLEINDNNLHNQAAKAIRQPLVDVELAPAPMNKAIEELDKKHDTFSFSMIIEGKPIVITIPKGISLPELSKLLRQFLVEGV